MCNKNIKRDLVLCGDIHGEFKKMVWTAISKYDLNNTDIIVLGDFGVGFDNKIKADYEEVEDRLEKHDLVIYALRGNHDDPSYFKDGSYDFPRLKFLKDYEIITLGDNLEILPIGGACSVDIIDRKELNEKLLAKGKKPVWWENEDVERKELKEIKKRVDVIISHESPILFEPVPAMYGNCTVEQYEKVLSSRNYLKDIALNVNSNYWFYGHYHRSMSGNFKETIWRCLDIMEFYKVPEKKITNPQGTLEKEEKPQD